MKAGTTPLQTKISWVPIQRLSVEVVDGVDAGNVGPVSGERLTIGTADGNDLQLSDSTISRYHLEVQRTPRGVRLIDLQSTNGTFVEGVFIERGLVRMGSTVRVGRTKLVIRDGETGRLDLLSETKLGGMVGQSQVMRGLMARVAKAAASDVSVLLVGESGTGKELVARAIHEHSGRAGKPYEIVDCASLAPQLVASELFGHERGAFTGAHHRHIGAFERAAGGTIFLDEIGELPAELQANLLGALERRRFRRVGGREELSVNVRVVAATNRDLRAEVNTGSFRLDLNFRLAVVRLAVPALREHPEDIPLLVEHFMREIGDERSVAEAFPPSELEAMAAYRWPGNVRELRNMVEASVAMGEAPSIPTEPGSQLTSTPPAGGLELGPELIDVRPTFGQSYKAARQRVVEQFERQYLADLLTRAEGNVSAAARLAKMDRSYLFSLLKKHEIR